MIPDKWNRHLLQRLDRFQAERTKIKVAGDGINLVVWQFAVDQLVTGGTPGPTVDRIVYRSQHEMSV